MTIGVGFLCSDGIVMCADRQITGEGGFKCEERKISRAFCDEYSLVFTYAGEPDASRVMYGKIQERFTAEFRKVKARSVRDRARFALENIFKNRHAKGLWTLIGIKFRNPSSFHLFKTAGHKVLAGRPMEHIGGGDSSVLRYVCDVLLAGHHTVNESAVLGAYVVSVASRYVDGCGGLPDITSICESGTIAEGSGGPFTNTRERFSRCEEKIGKMLRDLLLSGGMG